MKKFLVCVTILGILLLNLSCFLACSDCQNEQNNANITMLAEIIEISDTILVDVKESDIAFGVYTLIPAESVKYFSCDGSKIAKNDLKVGDLIEVKYSGQVMLSIPPQVVAYSITVK